MEYRLSNSADKDVFNILTYTRENFSYEQAIDYYQLLKSSFERITSHPNVGVSANYIYKDIRKLQVKKHVIYYIQKELTIYIVRVLHSQLDVEKIDWKLDE